MSTAQVAPAAEEAQSADSLERRVIAEIANRIGTLGVETADIAGNLDEISGRAGRQA